LRRGWSRHPSNGRGPVPRYLETARGRDNHGTQARMPVLQRS
jgi:hypothetical protein